MKFVVTGGCGFIGGHFVEMLLERGDVEEVRIIDNLTYAGSSQRLQKFDGSNRVTFYKLDIADRLQVLRATEGAHYLVHFAAESHVDNSILGPEKFAQTNAVGTVVLLEAALRNEISRFVHISTDEVYGSLPSGSATEESALRPNSPYAASKAASDLLVRSFHATYGLDVVTTRCTNNYGAYQHPEKLIPRFITRLLRNLPVPLYGDGLNVREWIHVRDHCELIFDALRVGISGETYNIGGGTPISNLELTRLLIQLTGQDDSLIQFVEDRLGHDFRYSVDDQKLVDLVGKSERKLFEQGLKETVDWYTENESWWSDLV